MKTPGQEHNLRDVVQKIAAGVGGQNSAGFFDQLTRNLAEITQADVSLVSRVVNDKSVAQSVSIFSHGQHLPNISYSMENTLCQQAITDGFAVFRSGVKDLLQEDSFFKQLDPEAYIGICLNDRHGSPVGVISLLYDNAIDNEDFQHDVLKIFATPAAMELARLREQVSQEFLQRRLNSILSIAREAIISVDENSNIILFNEGAESIFGFKSEEVLGRSINLLLPEKLRERHIGQMREFTEGPEISRLMTQRTGDIVAQRKDGRVFPAEASITKTHTEESRTVTVVLRDITERQESERALHSATRMQTLGNLAAGLAHDFNNILTLVRGSLDLINSNAISAEKHQHYLDVAVRATDRGAELVSRLLAFGRPRTLNPEPVNPAELINQLIDMLNVTLGEHINVQFQKQCSGCSVFADPSQLENAVVNLCFNARDAMGSEGGNVTLSLNCLQLSDPDLLNELQLQPGSYACIRVQDDGSGMTEDTKNNALEPFYSTKLQSGGTGLGLSMVLGFVRSAGGAMKIDSAVGQGTTVEIYLPVRNEVAPESEASKEEPQKGNATILIVEDQPDIRDLAVHYAKSLGYNVLEAEDGKQAFEQLDANPSIDLLFTDFQLPGGISGLDIAENVHKTRPEIKILISSGYSTQQVDLAKFPLLPKPYSLPTFAKYIQKVLGSEPTD